MQHFHSNPRNVKSPHQDNYPQSGVFEFHLPCVDLLFQLFLLPHFCIIRHLNKLTGGQTKHLYYRVKMAFNIDWLTQFVIFPTDIPKIKPRDSPFSLIALNHIRSCAIFNHHAVYYLLISKC